MEYLISIFMLGILLTRNDFNRYLYFVFGVFVLWIISMGFKRIREFRSLIFSLFLLSCVGTIFWHADKTILGDFPISSYLNIYIMANGVAFILAGALLVKLIIEYSKTLIPYFFTIPILLLFWNGLVARYSLLCALCCSLIIWSILNKKKLLPVIAGVILLSNFFRPYALYKLWTHILSWEQSLMETLVLGIGFPAKLIPINMVWVKRGNLGWVYVHNDFLALMRNLGIVPVALLVWFIVKEIKKVDKGWRLLLLLTIVILVIFQTNMYDVYKAMVILATFAVCITEMKAKKLVNP